MKQLTQLLGICVLITALSACVTTREQLNAEKGITSERESETTSQNKSSVKSENITQVPSPLVGPVPLPAQNQQVQTPPAQGPMVLPGPVTNSSAPITPVAPKKDLTGYTEDDLRAEVSRLTGQVEELQHEKQVYEQTRAEETKKSETRIAELEKQVKDLQPEVPTLPAGSTPLDAGKDAYQSGKYDEAIAFFTQSITQKDSGKDAEEATYLRGESYFKKQQFNKAIVDFSHFPEKFQKSSFHPKALLRIAESFEAMGRKDDAKAFYSDLMDKFPRTAEGKVAKKRLKVKL